MASAFSTGCNRGDKPGQIGAVAPNVVIHSSQRTIQLSQFRGKPLVLNFWATWCAPCLEELPSLMQMQKNLPGVQVLAVSIDDDPEAYQDFLKQYSISLLSVRDGSHGANLQFGTVKVPETYIIDRNGIVRRKLIGATNWTDPEIESYLAKL